MKNTISSLSTIFIIGFFVFCLLDSNTKVIITEKIENLLSLKDGTLTKIVSTSGGGGGGSKNETTKTNHSNEAKEYFNDIVMSSEFKGKMSSSFKWNKNMKIFVEGENSPVLMSELYRIVSELNDIVNPIEIEIVENYNDANMFVYFGSASGFVSLHPSIRSSQLNNNFGYFKVDSEKGEMYVDIYRTTEIDAQKHLLREELTQSLGLFNDSYKYPESIFYQGWTTTTEYAPIDRELIDMLYNE